MTLFGGDRSISIKMAINPAGVAAGIAVATKSVKDFSGQLETAAAKHKKAFGDLSGSMMLVGGAMAGAAVIAVKSFADFDQSMSRVKAATQASNTELGLLRQAAIVAGRDTKYSATEAADAITEMAKAGVSTKDILSGGLTGSLNLAAAGELSVADAANISATALTQFNLKGKDLSHVADLLAAGAGKAQGSVSDLAAALKYVGPVAHGMGVGIEQTVGVLTEFASQGIIGEQAGTSLRGVLLALTSPSHQAAQEMSKLGITMYDAQGKFVGVDGAAEMLHQRLGKLTEAQRNAALGTIFGNEQVTGARILYDGGAKAVADFTAKVNDQGYASRQAADLMDNLAGDVEQFKGSLETAFIQGGSGANGGLRLLTQGATEAVNAFSALPPVVQQGTVAVIGLSGAGLLLGGGLLKAVTTVVEFKKTLSELSVTSDGAKTKFGSLVGALGGPWGLAIGAGALALGYFMKQAADAKQRVDDLTAALQADSGAIGENVRASTAKSLSDSGALKAARDLGISIEDVTQAALGNADAMARVKATTDGVIQQQTDMQKMSPRTVITPQMRAAQGLNDILSQQSGDLKDATQAQKDQQAAIDAATPSTDKIKKKVQDLAAAEQAAAQSTDDLVKAVDALFGKFSLEADADTFTQKLKAISAAAKDANHDLHGNSDATLAARAAMRDAADASKAYIDDLIKQGASHKQVAATALTLAAAIDKAGQKAGLSKTATKQYSDVLREIPGTINTNINVNTAAATDKVSAWYRAWNNIQIAVGFKVGPTPKPGPWASGLVSHRATGGYITGSGSGTSDSIPAMLSNGEYVINAKQTAKYLPLLKAINTGTQGFATGGLATTATTPATPYSLSDVRNRYDATLPKPITAAQVTAAENRARNAALAVDKAERDLATTRRKHPHDINAIRDAEDRLDKARRAQATARTAEADAVTRSKAPRGFNLATYLGSLGATARQTTAYRKDLGVLAKRGGSQLVALLEAEGGNSADIVHALAKSSPAQLAQALKALRVINPTAFATTSTTTAGQVFNFAAGGLYDAQMAPDGAYRVWAERGTGGEAYIPLGAKSRPRSRMVASDVVARLGGTVAWSRAQVPAATSALPSASAATAGHGGPLLQVGAIHQTSGNPQEIAHELMFELRKTGI